MAQRKNLAALKTEIPALNDLAITTNGCGLKKRADQLKRAGLDRDVGMRLEDEGVSLLLDLRSFEPDCDDFLAGHSLATFAELTEVLADA